MSAEDPAVTGVSRSTMDDVVNRLVWEYPVSWPERLTQALTDAGLLLTDAERAVLDAAEAWARARRFRPPSEQARRAAVLDDACARREAQR